jgi:hypothetical protein
MLVKPFIKKFVNNPVFFTKYIFDIVKTLSDLQQPRRYEINFVTTNPQNGGKQVIARYFEIIRSENIQVNFTYE